MKLDFIAFIVFVLSLISCNNSKFESEKWLVTDHLIYPYREAMVDDLIKNYLHKGVNFEEISPLLGNSVELNTIKNDPFIKYYEIDIRDPDKATYLQIKLNSNGNIIKAELINPFSRG